MYTLKLWTDSMGSFTQPGCRDLEDALWHVNKAREHDGLHPLSMDDFEILVLKGKAKFVPERH